MQHRVLLRANTVRHLVSTEIAAAAANGKEAVEAPHIIFLETVGQGHINPTIPLVAELKALGCRVTYFADADGPHDDVDFVSENTPLGKAVIAAGADLRGYRVDQKLRDEPLLAGFIGSRWHKLPGLLEDLRSLQPRAILYDPFVAAFSAAARIVGVPAMALVPHSGPGALATTETELAIERAAGVREWLKAEHGLDLFELGVPSASWYSTSNVNLVTTAEETFAPTNTDAQRRLWPSPDCFRCVGTMNDPTKSYRPPQHNFPIEEIRLARDSGKRVILLSLGSVITGAYFKAPIGRMMPSQIKSNDDGQAKSNGKTLMDMFGVDLVHFVLKCAFGALGERDDILVILACGMRGPEAILEGLPPVPSNFRPFAHVPQLEVLPLCSAFITHGGMGSVMEAILFRVPMAVVPCFGDQMWNADCVQAAEIGFGFRYPLRTLNADALRGAVLALIDPSPQNTYRQAVEVVASKMERTGGAANAARIILGVAQGTGGEGH
eukprot:CAMPEP_0172631712 /NCGR_PEP_ID=MMETSP1068-20121228/180718_1 /TAXON_ID=35684 /ORGANISM="Pseudopedinella elastica, Strain CCMP716" /LENGTH=494 /DNA_ID=CAMNT_0013442935 /DNA_START=85 /DNA_END=1570 /DNA_ORIENTATION=+